MLAVLTESRATGFILRRKGMSFISLLTFYLTLFPFPPPPPAEQIFQNLRQEYSRIQRRRQLEGAFNQTEACSSSDAPSPSSSLNAPSSPPGRLVYSTAQPFSVPSLWVFYRCNWNCGCHCKWFFIT